MALPVRLGKKQAELPEAYLEVIARDSSGKVVSLQTQKLTGEALNSWQELKIHYKATEDQTVQVSVVNASARVAAYFDDLTLTQEPPLVVQENHYDPWGWNLAGIETQGTPNHKFQYNGKEKQEEFALNWSDYGFRMYDAQLGRWHAVDPVSDWAESLTPYRYGLNNPVKYIDLLGLWDAIPGGYSTSSASDISRFLDYMESETIKQDNTSSPSYAEISKFITNEMNNIPVHLRDGSVFLSTVKVQGYRDGRGTRWYTDQASLDNAWHQVQRTLTPDGTDTRTVGRNFFGLSYPGPNNPMTYSGKYDYSYPVKDWSELPAIGHDRRYDNLNATGATGLLFDTRTIGADWKFVSEQMQNANNPALSSVTQFRALGMAFGLGVLSLGKTSFKLASPNGFMDVGMWYGVSSVGVTNYPSESTE